jgi:diaminohydroxyphosphoribosylaminopyrimidine deaminase/5-amino-6-(5-phosphoribosylamino)uracil reductase
VVTLEPCNHHGRTPPCRQALIEAKIRRVVIALTDPTSRGEGGAAALRTAGVDVETGVLAGEARVLLGSWLAALTTRRPVVTWAYVISDEGITVLPDDMDDTRALRLNADAVLRADGSVSEAVAGSHGAGVLKLGHRSRGDPAEVLASLYEGGVRRLLLWGELAMAAPFLAADFIDRIYAYVPDGRPSRKPETILPWPQLPAGFAVIDAARLPGFVRILAQRESAP